jgi:hypothetical protein
MMYIRGKKTYAAKTRWYKRPVSLKHNVMLSPSPSYAALSWAPARTPLLPTS